MTSKHILLDTSIIIDFLRLKNKQDTKLYQLAAEKNLTLHISIITHTELHAGKSIWESKSAKKELQTLLSGLKVLPLTQTNLDLIDSLIAATALTNKMSLSTLNIKHFKKIKSLKLL